MTSSVFVFDMPCEEQGRAVELCTAKPCSELFVFEGCSPSSAGQGKAYKRKRRKHICAPRRRSMCTRSMTLGAEVVKAAMEAVSEFQKQAEADKRYNFCCVCWSKPIEVRLEPCGHTHFCKSCAERVRGASTKCPLCRAPISDIKCAKTGKSAKTKLDWYGTFREAPLSVLAARRILRSARGL